MNSKTRTLVITGGLVVAIVVLALLAYNTIYSTSSTKAITRTTTVSVGTVQSTVTATGNVAPATSLSLNFASSGIVTEVDVQPGAQVVAGQTLAKIDDTQTQAALNSAEAALSSAQANLASVEQPLTPSAAAQNTAALQSAQAQVATAQQNLASAQQSAQVNSVGYQNTLSQAQAQLRRDTAQYNSDQANCATTTTASSGGGSGAGQSCSSVLLTDQNNIAKDNEAVTNAQQAQTSGHLKDEQAIQQAQNSLTSAEDSLASTQASNNAKATPTPASVASAQAQVTTAQANLQTAQKNEENTVLTAPIAGTVAAVNGVVGQTVSGGGTSSASSSTSSSGSAGSSSTGGSGSSSSAFITLENISSLEVVAGFAEVDASKIQNGQAATVTLNALPNQSISGTVSNVAIDSTVVSNVVTYNVTITLTNPPAGAKPGMTANASVVVGEAANVLELPSADITTRAGGATVTLLRAGKQITQTVTTGLVGDEDTQITSGVSQGDVVVAPTVNITTGGSTTNTSTARGLGGGGLFSGGGGGGGAFGGGG
jgi:multidrug efflux pump subunit AcrA (membrane-fusion protein)